MTAHLLPQTKPELLIDLFRMKKARGDADLEDFKAVAKDFAAPVNCLIRAAEWAMAQWVAKRPDGVSDLHHARRIKFLADLRAVLNGDLTGWNPTMAQG